MTGPKDLSSEELRLSGLGLIERPGSAEAPVRRTYCLRCGGQVASERRETEPDTWWICARGCNTQFASSAPYPTDFPLPAPRAIRRRFESR